MNSVRGGPEPTIAEFAAADIGRVSLGGSLARAAYTALKDAGEELLGAGTFGFAYGIVSAAYLNGPMWKA